MAEGKRQRQSDNTQRGNLFLRNGRWYVRVQIRGRDIWRSAPTKEGAQKILGDLRGDADRKRIGLPKTSRATVKTWADDNYLPWARMHKKSAAGDELLLRTLEPTFGHMRLGDVTKAHVDAYQKERLAKVSGPTINREVAVLRRLLSHAVEAEELDANPLLRVRMLPESPARQPSLSPDDERLLLAACKPPWLAAIVRVALATGCRQGELLALRWRHVDFEAASLVIADSKSGESRRVPLHPAIVAELKAREGNPDGFVFTMANGKPPARFTLGEHFREAVRAIGRPDLRFHDLRHVAGSRLLAEGANLPEIATFLGHKTLICARRYAHTNWNRLQDLVGRMPAPVEPGGGKAE